MSRIMSLDITLFVKTNLFSIFYSWAELKKINRSITCIKNIVILTLLMTLYLKNNWFVVVNCCTEKKVESSQYGNYTMIMCNPITFGSKFSGLWNEFVFPNIFETKSIGIQFLTYLGTTFEVLSNLYKKKIIFFLNGILRIKIKT